jgi:hypothetical protein
MMEYPLMTTDEVIGTLKANIGRTVRVIYTGGETELLFIHSVDDEGFVNDPISPDENTHPPDKQEWWARFEDITEVHAVEPSASVETPQS